MNIKSAVFALFFLIPFSCLAQQAEGVHFYTNLILSQALKKAKAENKYVFIDCYATWCEPCKMMDKEIYPNAKVADLINSKFIAIKFQMDSTTSDPQYIKALYKEVNRLNKEYSISAFPTFLFFSPDGRLVHKGLGYQGLNNFIKLATNAMNPKQQYYTLLSAYRRGKLNMAKMPYLLNESIELGDKSLAGRIAKDYLDNYLLKSSKQVLLEKRNIEFIVSCISLNLITSQDKAFRFFYDHAGQIDSLLAEPLYAEKTIDFVIAHEYIDPLLIRDGKLVSEHPDWDKMQTVIASKFNADYAERTILMAKDRVLSFQKDWPAWCANETLLLQKYGDQIDDGSFAFTAWSMFQHATKQEELDVVIHRMQKLLATNKDSSNVLPAAMDTYANLLYKTGRKQEGIETEKNALAIAEKFNIPNFKKEFQTTIDKMQKGEPTW